MHDNHRVAIKVVKKSSNEIDISRMLSSKEYLSDPLNHCVEVFDVLPDCTSPDTMLLIMEFLHPCDDPPFASVDEILEFMKQTLEAS